MKKIRFLMMMLVLATLQAWAMPVDNGSAKSLVLDFINSMSGNGTLPVLPGGTGLQLVYTEASSVDVTKNAYYIYNYNGGFVIVAGDDRATGILAYGDHPLDMNHIPDAMQYILDCYKEQIDYLLERPGLVVRTPARNATGTSATTVEPMLTALWDQEVPYNDSVPRYNGEPCMTGCSCTALCQVMYYWKHPQNPTPRVPEYTTVTNKIFMPELPSITFNWDNMIDSYKDGYTDEQAAAVAQLMLYVGQAEKMEYRPRSAGGSTAHILLIRHASQMLGYNPDSEVISKKNSGLSDAEWEELMLNELYAGRPIVYTAKDSIKNKAHAFDIDGYDGEKYHINWGWSGLGDGYYAFKAFNPRSYHFNTQHLMIVGLEPRYSEIEVNTAELSFNGCIGDTLQQTFVVSGTDLTGDLTLELNDDSGCYSIDKTVIARETAAVGDTVTVTYSPTNVGETFASITISGSCAEAKTVNLSGVADVPEASITVSKSVVAFNETTVTLGTGRTQSITITGTNLTDDIHLSVSGYHDNSFTVAKTTITPEEAAGGTNVVLRFKPTISGVNQATLQIQSDGAETINVPLIGIGVKLNESNNGYITASTTDLSLETQVGRLVTRTIRVYYTPYGSNGGGALMVSNSNNGNDAIGSDSGDSQEMLMLRPSSNIINTTQTTIDADKLKWIKIPGDLIPIDPPIIRSGRVVMAGDDCFSITPKTISYNQLSNGVDITVTYDPKNAGTHEAYIAISMPYLMIYKATPILVHITGSATDDETLMAPLHDNDEPEVMMDILPYEETDESFGTPIVEGTVEGMGNTITGVDELTEAVKIYADGQDIIIETPVDQSAIISDIAGHARQVNLTAGRNAIPTGASGIHIVRVGNHSAKLMLR